MGRGYKLEQLQDSAAAEHLSILLGVNGEYALNPMELELDLGPVDVCPDSET